MHRCGSFRKFGIRFERTIRRRSSIDKIRSQLPIGGSPAPQIVGVLRSERHETRSGPERRVQAPDIPEERSGIRLGDLLRREDWLDKRCLGTHLDARRNREVGLRRSPASRATRSVLKARADKSEGLVQRLTRPELFGQRGFVCMRYSDSNSRSCPIRLWNRFIALSIGSGDCISTPASRRVSIGNLAPPDLRNWR